MNTFFKYIDLLPFNINLKFKNSESLRTSCGGILSCFLIILMIISIFLFSQDFYLRNNPLIVKKDVYHNSTLLYDPNSDNDNNFGMVLYFENSNEDQIVYKNTSIITTMFTLNISLASNYKNISVINKVCPSHYKTIKNFQKVCFDFSNISWPSSEYIKDNFDISLEEKIIFLSLSPCINTESLKCKEIIPFRILLAFNQLVENFDNYDEPLSTNYLGKILSFNISPGVDFPSINLFFNKFNLTTDNGWLFSNIDSTSKVDFSHHESQTYKKNNNNYYMTSRIRFSNKEKYVLRRYLRIHEIYGNIFGILQFILLIFELLNSLFSTRLYNLELINSLFYYNSHSKDNMDLTKNSHRILAPSKSFSSERSDKNPNFPYINYKIEKIFLEALKFPPENDELRYSCLDLCKVFLCCRRDKTLIIKEKFYDNSLKKLFNLLDIRNIIKNQVDNYRLKKILLDDRKLSCIDYLSLRKISIDESINKYDDEDNIHNNLMKIIDFYKERVKLVESSDKNLIDMMDKKFFDIKLFE